MYAFYGRIKIFHVPFGILHSCLLRRGTSITEAKSWASLVWHFGARIGTFGFRSPCGLAWLASGNVQWYKLMPYLLASNTVRFPFTLTACLIDCCSPAVVINACSQRAWNRLLLGISIRGGMAIVCWRSALEYASLCVVMAKKSVKSISTRHHSCCWGEE